MAVYTHSHNLGCMQVIVVIFGSRLGFSGDKDSNGDTSKPEPQKENKMAANVAANMVVSINFWTFF
jgi:hypothetical protein